MKNDKIESIEYNGLTADIYQDTMYQDSPNDWGDDGMFLVAFHRDFSVERDGFSQDVCRSIVDPKEYPDYKNEAAEIRREYHAFGLEAYIHSGVSLSLSYEGNYPDRRWDVSQLGLVFIAKSEARTKSKARTLALGLIKTWNQNLSGDVYGYSIEATNDSCWGFYGYDSVKEAAQEALEYAWKSTQKKHEDKKRAEIKNRVPLEKRTTFSLLLV